MATRDIERILREVGAAQHGVAGRSQLMARGIAGDTVDRLVRNGRLVTLGRGVYQVGPVPLERSAEASAVLRCGVGCRLSHMSAAVLHELMAVRAHQPVEVTVERRRRRRVEGVRIHRVRVLLPDEATAVAGLPVTTPSRTLLDLAATMAARDVEQALAKALRTRHVTKDDVALMLERHPRHGGAPLLAQLIEIEGGPAFTRSEAEEKLLRIVRQAGLPGPEVNARVLGYEVDFLWRQSRVVVEVDGWAYHNSARSFVADRRRDAELAAAGYRVLRFTWADVSEARLSTAVRLARLLAN